MRKSLNFHNNIGLILRTRSCNILCWYLKQSPALVVHVMYYPERCTWTSCSCSLLRVQVGKNQIDVGTGGFHVSAKRTNWIQFINAKPPSVNSKYISSFFQSLLKTISFHAHIINFGCEHFCSHPCLYTSFRGFIRIWVPIKWHKWATMNIPPENFGSLSSISALVPVLSITDPPWQKPSLEVLWRSSTVHTFSPSYVSGFSEPSCIHDGPWTNFWSFHNFDDFLLCSLFRFFFIIPLPCTFAALSSSWRLVCVFRNIGYPDHSETARNASCMVIMVCCC